MMFLIQRLSSRSNPQCKVHRRSKEALWSSSLGSVRNRLRYHASGIRTLVARVVATRVHLVSVTVVTCAWSHPRPNDPSAPCECPSRVQDQSANSCYACWCVAVRRTRCRVVFVESPALTFVDFPLACSLHSSLDFTKQLQS